ncbi:acyl carrier protein [Anaerocolumna jejuensis]|uniref:acyl carrier protein n=1 Tax=Anaerocolumna jejuensis TaxID=259063 RepID=UPI003F7B62A3
MNINETLKEVIVGIATQYVNKEEINEETILTTDLGFDSVQVITLIVELESVFKIEIEDYDLEIENLIVYKKLYKMIENKIMNNPL